MVAAAQPIPGFRRVKGGGVFMCTEIWEYSVCSFICVYVWGGWESIQR